MVYQGSKSGQQPTHCTSTHALHLNPILDMGGSSSAPRAEAGPLTELEVSNMRKIIASRLLESKTTIPHYYLTSEIQVDALMKYVEMRYWCV